MPTRACGSGSPLTAIRAIRNVDPVDWVERIPIAETRNYVQRIMENLQVYRARFGGGSKLVVDADMRRGGPSYMLSSQPAASDSGPSVMPRK